MPSAPKKAKRGSPVTAAEWLDPLDEFLAFLALEKGLSEKTVEDYRSDLMQFARFGIESFQRPGWSKIVASDVSDWIYSLSEAGYESASLCRKLSSLRAMSLFLYHEGKTESHVLDLLTGPKLLRRAPETLSTREIERLLAAPAASTASGLRDRALLELAYASGLRVSELCSLRLQDLALDSDALKVFGKGSKERALPIGRKAKEALESYLRWGRPALVKSVTGAGLFLSNRGTSLSRKTVWHLVRKHGRSARIAKTVKPHTLRHSFATHLLSGGADLRVIQELLGHADISTTQIYTAVEASRIATAHDAFHPRSRDFGPST